MIEFDKYSIYVCGDYILKDISFSIKENGIYVLCGPSGSGKSTILNTIARTDYIHNCRITGNKTLDYNSTDVHYVSVDDNVFGFFTVNDNLKLFSSNQNRIDEILKELNIFELKNKKCSLLSKGERERVAIASGLIDDKPILLIDEPTANLDNEFSKVAYDVILKYGHEKITIIATHDYKMIEDKADGLIYLDNGEIVKNTIKETDNKITLTKRKSRLPIRSYFKFGFANLFTSKTRFVINTIIMTFTFLLVFVAFANLTADYNKKYRTYLENSINTDYVKLEKNLNNKSVNEFLESEDLPLDSIAPTFSVRIAISDSNYIGSTTTYTSYYTNPEIDEKIRTFSSRYNFTDKNYRYYPIYFSERMIEKCLQNYIYLSPGDICEINDPFDDDYKLIFDGTFSNDIYFDSVLPESFYLEKFNDHITLKEDFHYNLNYYKDIRNYINSLSNSSDLVRLTYFMELGYIIKPFSSELEIVKGTSIVNENEIVISNEKFYDLLFSEDSRISEFNKKYQESISINNPSYYLKGILDKVKVVGLTSSAKNEIYISPTVYNKIKNNVINNNYIESCSIALKKEYIMNNLKLIKARNYGFRLYDEQLIEDYESYAASKRLGILVFAVSSIFALISIGVSTVYLHNINKKNYKNYSVMMLTGKSKKDIYLTYLLMTALNIVIPLIICLILGCPATLLVKNLFLSIFGAEDTIFIYNLGYGYLSSFILALILITLLFPTIAVLRKKNAIKYLNYD